MQKDNAKNKQTYCFMFLFLMLLMSSSSSWWVKLNWFDFYSDRVGLNWKYAQFDSNRVENVGNPTSDRVEFKMSTRNSTRRSVYAWKSCIRSFFRGYSKVKQNAIVIALTTSATRSFSTLSFAITTCTWIRISVDVYFRRLFWKLRMRWICPCRSRPILVIAF